MPTVALPNFCPDEWRSVSHLHKFMTRYLPFVDEEITIHRSVGYNLAAWWIREYPMVGAADGCIVSVVLRFTKQPDVPFPIKPSKLEQLLTGYEGAVVGHFNGCGPLMDAFVKALERYFADHYTSTSTALCTPPTTTPPSPSSSPSLSALSSGRSP